MTRSTLDTGMTRTLPDDTKCAPRTVCEGCGNEIDPDTCGCGEAVESHGMFADHSSVPMGCDCYRAKPPVVSPLVTHVTPIPPDGITCATHGCWYDDGVCVHCGEPE